jgi:hypothetical protein
MGFKKYGDERSSSEKVAETRPEDNERETYESIRRELTQSEIDRGRDEDDSGTSS